MVWCILIKKTRQTDGRGRTDSSVKVSVAVSDTNKGVVEVQAIRLRTNIIYMVYGWHTCIPF